MVAARSWEEMDTEDVSQGYKLAVIRMGAKNLTHSLAPILNNTVSCAWKLLRVHLTTHIHTH